MLRKLLKYDLKWIYKTLIIFYVLTIIFSLIGKGLTNIENSMVLNIIGKISIGIAVGMMIGAIINSIIRSWVRLLRNLYKDESYLTHTLPVNRSTIYLSKVLASFIVMITTVLVILISLVICYYSKANYVALKDSLEGVAIACESSLLSFLIVAIATLVLELFFVQMVGFTGIIFGYKSNNNKIVTSVVVAFILYVISQIVSLSVMFIFALFNESIMNLFKTVEQLDINAIKILLMIGIVLYMTYVITYYIIGKKKLEKGVDVD